MDDEHRWILRKKYIELRDIFSDSIDEICIELQSQKILSRGMKEDILAERTSLKQASALLDRIPSRGPKAFDALYTACIEHEIHDAANILKPNIDHHNQENPIESDVLESDSVEPIQEPWQPECYPDKVIALQDEVTMVEDKRLYEQHVKDISSVKEEKKFYKMTRETRGHSLLFYDGEKPFSLDRQGLGKLFDKLNFESMKVTQVKGPTVNWNDYIPNDSSTEQDCFVLFIMSSCRNGFLNKQGTIKAILDAVKTKKYLVKKPKLIFHITRNTAPVASGATPSAHDGNSEVGNLAARNDETTEQQSDPVKDLKLKTPPDVLPKHRVQDTAIHRSKDELDGYSHSQHSTIPKDSDIFFIRSTEYGSETLGSGNNKYTRCIYLLVFYFAKYAHSHEFYKLMSLLNTTPGHDTTTVVRLEKDTGGKSLYFFPGCFSNERR